MNQKSFYVLIFLGLILWFIFGRKDNTWRGFYYEGGSFASVVYSPEYKTKEDCIAWGENERQRRPSDSAIAPQDLYECGKNCKVQNKEVGLHICEVKTGETKQQEDETRNVRWIKKSELKNMVKETPEKFFTLHLGVLEMYLKD